MEHNLNNLNIKVNSQFDQINQCDDEIKDLKIAVSKQSDQDKEIVEQLHSQK